MKTAARADEVNVERCVESLKLNANAIVHENKGRYRDIRGTRD